MINADIYDYVKKIAITNEPVELLKLLDTIYPDYDDTVLRACLNNALLEPKGKYDKLISTATDDLYQFITLHGVFLTTNTPLSIMLAIATLFLESTVPDTVSILKDLIYEDDPELTIASMAAYVSDIDEANFIDHIDHIDEFLIEKLSNGFDDVIGGEPVQLQQKILIRLKSYVRMYPESVVVGFINNGGALGGSAETYRNVLKPSITIDNSVTNHDSVAINIVAIELMAGHPIRQAKKEAVAYVNEAYANDGVLRDNIIRSINSIDDIY